MVAIAAEQKEGKFPNFHAVNARREQAVITRHITSASG